MIGASTCCIPHLIVRDDKAKKIPATMTGAGILRHLDSRYSPLVFSDFDDLEVLFKCLRGAFDEVGAWCVAGQ